MIHPIFRTVLGRPELIADHLSGYVALVKEEATAASKGAIHRAIAGAVALVCAVLALILIGVAIMMGAVHGTFHWALVAVPGVAVILAVAAGIFAARPSQLHAFAELRAQFDADVHAFHLAGKHDHVD